MLETENVQSTSVIRYRFEADDSTNSLKGIVETVASQKSTHESSEKNTQTGDFTLAKINESLQNQGYSTYDFLPGSIDSLLALLKNKENGQVNLAVKRDATINLAISGDKNTVKATTTAAMGGKPLTVQEMKATLEKNQIDQRTIDKEQLKILISATTNQCLIIAKSLPVINGENTRFTSLVEGKSSREKDLTALTAIDLKEAYDFAVIDEGTPVMKKIPATNGKPGLNVFGKEIKPKAGKKIAFKTPLIGVKTSPDNENILISSIKGHPTAGLYAVKVEPMLVVDAVDSNTGNIVFDGTLVVNKNIESGFIVEVTGDVIVKGSIHKAIINISGNLTVAGGIQAEVAEAEEEHINNLNIEGDLTAKFLNQCNIQCLGDIHIDEYILHCDIFCKGSINVGQERGKGCIIGGSCKSEKEINCKVVGSNAYISTQLTLASARDIKKEIRTENKNLERRQREQEQLDGMLQKLELLLVKDTTNNELIEKSKKVKNLIEILNKTISDIGQTITTLNLQLEEMGSVELKIFKNLYPNVTITINESSWVSDNLIKKTLIKEEEGSIIIGSF